MLQRSGEALYSSWAGDKPRTSSATTCVVISKWTIKCSRSALLMGAAKREVVRRVIVRIRSEGRQVFIVMRMIATVVSEAKVLGRIEDCGGWLDGGGGRVAVCVYR